MKTKFSWKAYKEAVENEMREHRSSFILYGVLRFFVFLTLIRQAYLGTERDCDI